MTEPRPTEPLPRPPANDPAGVPWPGGTGCRDGHGPPHNPALHPRWGQVPSLSNALIGAGVLAVLLVLAWWLLPDTAAVVVTALALLGLVVSAAIQAALGHRGRCWRARSWRWWLGPLGALLDPFDTG